MRFEIVEIDNDTFLINSKFMVDFKDQKLAQEFCDKKSWKKYKYYISKQFPK